MPVPLLPGKPWQQRKINKEERTMFGRSKGPANPVTATKDASGAAAVDLGAVKAQGHVSLAMTAETVGMSLRKRNLAGMRGRLVVVLDHSGSMRPDFQGGLVQKLLERTLAFGLQIDSDGSIEVLPFDSQLWPVTLVDLGNYQSAARTCWNQYEMGLTNLAAALEAVRDMASKTTEPIVCVVITDGNPYDGRDEQRSMDAATKVVCDLARYPVFVKFLAIRDVPYLRHLDDLEQTRPGDRLLDNVDAKTIRDPGGISDADFAEAMTDEWDSWLIAARAAGVLVA
jgi:hypothetical protein